MNIILVYLGDLLHCPPAMSLGKVLEDLGYETKFITYDDEKLEFAKYFEDMTHVEQISIGASNTKSNPFIKFFRFWIIKHKLWNLINQYYNDDSLIWIVSNGSLKYFGKKLLQKKYILHLLELTEELYFVESRHLLPLSREYILNAVDVVECEYNRAHISKAWWGLKRIPSVLQNKPYNSVKIGKNNPITSNETVKNVIEKLKDKKIILYQGNISKERPLDNYIKAVAELGDDFAFVAMVNGKNPYQGKSSNYFYIPFVNPPFHLEVTSHAYIGILSYTPVKNSYSILNTVYCAPNKIWEYSQFGVPMISNDLPALKYHFEKYNDGIACIDDSVEAIKKAIVEISSSYDTYSYNSSNMFDTYDLKMEVNKILKRSKGNE